MMLRASTSSTARAASRGSGRHAARAAAAVPRRGGRHAARAAATTTDRPFAGRDTATDDRSARAENVPGPYFVDHTCIDCDTCRLMAPETFGRVGSQSAAVQQPTTEAGRVEALQALLSCPTFSIHVTAKSPEALKAAQQGLPRPVPGTRNVFANGWRSVKSIACESYFIVRPQGNVMVDTPRFNPVLAARLKALGGVKYIALTHKDDVGEHAAWAKAFKATRILHADEVVPDTEDVELKLTGTGPWKLPDGGDDFTMVFTPGHTSAHVVFYYAPDKCLFTGDHLAAGFEPGRDLDVFKDFCWYNFEEQLESVRKLLELDFLHVLPGHGRPAHLKDAAHRLKAVSELLQRHGAAAPAAAVAAK